jgi:glycerol-3-phosphate acyltransferase PlsX
MMSGDFGLRITVPAALQALQSSPKIFLHLVGDQPSLENALCTWPEAERSRCALLHAPDSLSMGDQPSDVLKSLDASPMRIALEALSREQVAAVLSAGNAGALMILARKLIGMLEGAGRPAFCSAFPTRKGVSLMLDLGANVDCSGEQLCSFAVLGSALYSALYSQPSPRVALLSNGVEAGKGNLQSRRAATLIDLNPTLNYTGYIEADTLHDGIADVVVSDGFSGNVALKAIEGTAKLAAKNLANLLRAQTDVPISAAAQAQLLTGFSSAMDPELHNGAFLLGLAGIVVKAHGNSSVDGFAAAIGQAVKCQEHRMIARISEQLARSDSPVA